MSSFAINHETIATTEQNFITDIFSFLSEFLSGDIDETEFSELLDINIELSREY